MTDKKPIRYESSEIGRNDAACPLCHFNSGKLIHADHEDFLECGACQHTFPVGDFILEGFKALCKQGMNVSLNFRDGKYYIKYI